MTVWKPKGWVLDAAKCLCTTHNLTKKLKVSGQFWCYSLEGVQIKN